MDIFKAFFSQNNIKEEICTGHKGVPIDIITKVKNSICKITIEKEKGLLYGTGFFLRVSDSLKFIFTNYHIVNPNLRNKNIKIEIWNKKMMNININFNNRIIKYFERPKDITIIEIKETDDIYKDIEFLDYDNNYFNHGYKIYKNVDIFSIEHPFGKGAVCASGTILNIKGYEFDHNISTDIGASGSPIILINDNINFIQVIGIHKYSDLKNKINVGTFIGEILNEINKNINLKDKNENFFKSDMNTDYKDVKKDLKLINLKKENNNSFLQKDYHQISNINKISDNINEYKNKITLIIVDSQNKRIKINCDYNITVKELKKYIKEKIGIPESDGIVLIYNGNFLENEDLLIYYNISDYSEVCFLGKFGTYY